MTETGDNLETEAEKNRERKREKREIYSRRERKREWDGLVWDL